MNLELLKTPSLVRVARSGATPPASAERVAEALGVSRVEISWLAGDGSDRCYYRIHIPETSKTCVMMQLSPKDSKLLEDQGYDWILIANILSHSKIPCPKVIATLFNEAALIIEDYGDIMLESVISQAIMKNEFDATLPVFGRCFSMISTMLSLPQSESQIWCQRAFDNEKYLWELNFFKQQFITGALGLEFDKNQSRFFNNDINALTKFLAPRSSYFVHRDFHTRNIMSSNDFLALIDFQDARLGSKFYDMVSLVFDNYLPLSLSQRKILLARGIEFVGMDSSEDERELYAVILQRQLKAIGSYAYLTIDKKRGDYLPYISPALESLTGIPEIFHEGWPFLSKDLPRLLSDLWGQR